MRHADVAQLARVCTEERLDILDRRLIVLTHLRWRSSAGWSVTEILSDRGLSLTGVSGAPFGEEDDGVSMSFIRIPRLAIERLIDSNTVRSHLRSSDCASHELTTRPTIGN